jgi:hypothetical protein
VVALTGSATAVHADSYVGGYTRSNGTYVAPHYRSSPNGTTSDNWSASGNYNPYTGVQGSKSYDPAYPSYSGSSGYGGYGSSSWR